MFSMFSMFNMHVHACMCACMRACMGHPHTHPCPFPHPSTHPPTPPGGGPPESLKNSITLQLIQDISIPFEDLKSVKEFPTHGWVCGLVGGWVVGWVDGWGQVKSLTI